MRPWAWKCQRFTHNEVITLDIIKNSICAPKGFLCSGVFTGLKKNPQKKDIALIYSETPATAAGVFTINQAKAAPLILTEQHLKNGKMQAIIVNSGNANACTGAQGLTDATTMAQTTADALDISVESVAVASTGVIGVPLPIEKVVKGIQVAASHLGTVDEDTMQGIMTTDTFTKSIAVEFELDGKKVRIGGIAKGSGMIHPMMATMLAFITTDAAISQPALQQMLTEVNEDSFHMISVDGDTSTNDMVMVLANGLANNSEISSENTPAYDCFKKAFAFVCTELAKLIVEDGEGATKLIEINILGAKTKVEARTAARAVSKSSLVKAAVFGEDANWGRIVSAIGASGVTLDLDKVSVTIGNLLLFQNGTPIPFDEAIATEQFKEKLVVITVNLGIGNENATAWGCDLTYGYVKINADYRS